MRAVEPTWRRVARVWWAFTWRWPALLLIPLVPYALLVGLVRPDPAVSRRLTGLLVWPMALWAQAEAVRRVLKMDFDGWSVRIVDEPDAGNGHAR